MALLFWVSEPCLAGINYQQVRIGYHTFQVEVADSPETWEKGLMFRTFLPKHRGMLFLFDHDDVHTFWMKNTMISLDMIWISAQDKIVFIKSKAEPMNTTIINPGVEARYVLEVRGGLSEDYHYAVGDMVMFIPSLSAKSIPTLGQY